MSNRLRAKRALITAAGQGIGRAIAEAFAAEGAHVIATDINLAVLETLRANDKITVKRLDVRDNQEVNLVVGQSGAVDVLVNCAGFVHHGTILDCTDQDWAVSIDLNVTSMYRLCRAMLPTMVQRRGGSIINVASVASSVRGLPNRFAYGATKAAVIGLTKSVAIDFVGVGIRCNAICPGTVDTPSLRQRLAAQPDPEAAMRQFVARQPMGRFGRPEEVASLAVHLASDESRFTTGAIHLIDGGMTT